MDKDKQKALEDAGWKFGDADDFLSSNNEEKIQSCSYISKKDLQGLSRYDMATRGPVYNNRIESIPIQDESGDWVKWADIMDLLDGVGS